MIHKLILGLFLSLFLSFAFATEALIYIDGKNYVRLFDKPCAIDTVLTMTPPQFRDGMQMGEAQIEGVKYAMCWTLLPNGQVGIVYTDGEQGLLPSNLFKPEVNS